MQKNDQVITIFKKEFDKKLVNKLYVGIVFFIIAIILFIISTVFVTIEYNAHIVKSYQDWEIARNVVNPDSLTHEQKELLRLGPDMYNWKVIARFSTGGNGFWAYPMFIFSMIILTPSMIFVVLFFLINFFPIDWDKRKEKKMRKTKIDTETRKLTKVGN